MGCDIPTHSHPLASYRTLYDKTALYYAHGTLYRLYNTRCDVVLISLTKTKRKYFRQRTFFTERKLDETKIPTNKQ